MPSKTPRNIWLNKLLPACLRWHFDTNLGVKEIPSDFPPFSPLSRLRCRSQTRWNWPWPRIRPAVLQMHARKPWKRWVPHIPLLIKFSTSTLELWKWGKGGGNFWGDDCRHEFRQFFWWDPVCTTNMQMYISNAYVPYIIYTYPGSGCNELCCPRSVCFFESLKSHHVMNERQGEFFHYLVTSRCPNQKNPHNPYSNTKETTHGHNKK